MKRILFLAIAVLCSVYGVAQTIIDNDKEILEKIKQENLKHSSINCNFKQTKHISILGENIISEGLFFYEKPDKLSMQYTNPEGDLMSIDGDKFVMITSGKRNETSAKSNAKMRGMKTILSSCLQGDVLQMEAAAITCEEDAKYYIVTADINKKTNKSNISKVTTYYNKSNLTVSILRTEEQDGSYTVYELVDKK